MHFLTLLMFVYIWIKMSDSIISVKTENKREERKQRRKKKSNRNADV